MNEASDDATYVMSKEKRISTTRWCGGIPRVSHWFVRIPRGWYKGLTARWFKRKPRVENWEKL